MKKKIPVSWHNLNMLFSRNEFLEQAIKSLIQRYNWAVEDNNRSDLEKKLPISFGATIRIHPAPSEDANNFIYKGSEILWYNPRKQELYLLVEKTIGDYFGLQRSSHFQLKLSYFEIDVPDTNLHDERGLIVNPRWNHLF